MTAQSATLDTDPIRAHAHRPLLGVATVLRKELTEWVRGPKALIVLGVAAAAAVFMTLIPFIAEATNEAAEAGLLSHDPTANVLLGWTGQTIAFMAVLSTMALLSGERDRGTLAWTLSNPVSPTSVVLGKTVVAFTVFIVAAVLVPMLISIGIATVAYGALPDLRVVGTFTLLFLALPALFIALTIAVGTTVRSTVGVAGVAFAVMFLPQVIGGLVPIVNELSPTSIGSWALLVAKGEPASMLTPISWAVTMVVLVVGAAWAFNRQEL